MRAHHTHTYILWIIHADTIFVKHTPILSGTARRCSITSSNVRQGCSKCSPLILYRPVAESDDRTWCSKILEWTYMDSATTASPALRRNRKRPSCRPARCRTVSASRREMLSNTCAFFAMDALNVVGGLAYALGGAVTATGCLDGGEDSVGDRKGE